MSVKTSRTVPVSIRLYTLGFAILPLVFGPRVNGVPLSWLAAIFLMSTGLAVDTERGRLKTKLPTVLIILVALSATVAWISGQIKGVASSSSNSWLLITGSFAVLALLMLRKNRMPLSVLRNGLMLSGLFISVTRATMLAANPSLDLSLAQVPVLTEYYLQSAYILSLSSIASFHAAIDKSSRGRQYKTVAWSMFAITVATNLTFAGRASLLMVVAGVWIILALSARTLASRLRLVGSTAAIVMLGIFLYFSPAGALARQRLTDVEALEQNSLRRGMIQDLALTVVYENPLGIGWDGLSNFSALAFQGAIRSTHNLYSGLILSVGLIGMICMTLLLLLIVGAALNTPNRLTNLPAALAIVILGAGLVDDITVYPIGFAYLIMVISLCSRVIGEGVRIDT